MGMVTINPAYRDFLEQQHLTEASQLVDLPGVIICGHPRRHVRRVTLPCTLSSPTEQEGGEAETMSCFLKREHRVGWRQRLANAWAGFGLVADAQREQRLLQLLHRAGVGCPEWIATGEDDQGRAFLLVRALNGTLDLPSFLRRRREADPRWRRCFARHLGQTLAHLHDAGFQHRDLYAKHVLVDPHDASLYLLDWQRGRQRAFLDWRHRWHDLAALHATLPASLASPRERLACLHGYLRATLLLRPPRVVRRRAVFGIHHRAEQLLRRRKVREERQAQVALGQQQLIWLDGEALCVTPELLTARGRPTLVYRQRSEFWRWLWCRLRRRPFTSPEVRQASLLFRLQRHGIATPRLLALGQRHRRPWQTESFVLTEMPLAALQLVEWLKNDRAEAKLLLRLLARLLQRLHRAGCYWAASTANPLSCLAVQGDDRGTLTLLLTDLTNLVCCRHPSKRRALRDVVAMWTDLPTAWQTRTQAVRFVRAYLQRPHLRHTGRRLVMRLLTTAPAPRPRSAARLVPSPTRASP